MWSDTRLSGPKADTAQGTYPPAAGAILEDSHLPDQHPRGTLALVVLMGLLYAVGWAAFYFLLFLGRGPVSP